MPARECIFRGTINARRALHHEQSCSCTPTDFFSLTSPLQSPIHPPTDNLDFELLAYDGAKVKLVEDLGYPKEVLNFQYDSTYYRRGMYIYIFTYTHTHIYIFFS
jgi:hypothetical protein